MRRQSRIVTTSLIRSNREAIAADRSDGTTCGVAD